MKKVIPIGCDHAGVELKNAIIEHLTAQEYVVKNLGTDTLDSIDYPDYGHPVAEVVEKEVGVFGIVICGSGNGINMTVNKHKGIRSALCWTVELAKLARLHNNANIIALPARFISIEEGIKMVDVFLNTEFEGGRHAKRVDKIPC